MVMASRNSSATRFLSCFACVGELARGANTLPGTNYLAARFCFSVVGLRSGQLRLAFRPDAFVLAGDATRTVAAGRSFEVG